MTYIVSGWALNSTQSNTAVGLTVNGIRFLFEPIILFRIQCQEAKNTLLETSAGQTMTNWL